MIQSIQKINPMLVNSKVRPKHLPTDVLDQGEETTTEGRKRMDYYFSLWLSLQTWRTDREKWAKYYNNDQWHETITDDDGNNVREDEYISAHGKIPLQQNLIKPIFNSIIGQFRSDRGKTVVISRVRDKATETEMLSNALQASLDYNDSREVDVASLIEKGISGLCVQKLTYSYWPEDRRWDALIENINPNFMFFNSDCSDVRWRDLRCIGRIIDTTFGKVLASFGNNIKKIEKLKSIYQNPDRYKAYSQNDTFDPERNYRLDFYMPDDLGKCRVIEAWELKTVIVTKVHDWMDGTEREFDGTIDDVLKLNQYRVNKYIESGFNLEEVPQIEAWQEYAERWFYGFYSPYGDILDEGETPYWHGSHPFILPPNHSVDNKISGLVDDLYDTQRQINRLKSLQDFILGTSAKNTLILDEDSLNGKSVEEIAQEYVKVGGVIALKLRDGAKLPIELGKNVANLGIPEMIRMNMEIMRDISGVYPSLQGQEAAPGTPASRVITEAQNSSLNLKQFIESFGTFRKDRNEKLLKVIQQFYDEPRWIAVAGNSYSDTAKLYEPDMVRDLEFSTVLAQSADSPVYRNVIDEALKEFMVNGLIDFETYLTNTSLPYADSLLESVRKRKEQAQNDPNAAMAGLQADMPQGNPQAMGMLKKAVGR
jgi:hypothetical protein